MQDIDLNLLVAAHALLIEESVTRAATRLHLSVPATSRALARCRRAFADPLLVRRGRGVVITPRGRELRDRLGPLVDQIAAVVAPARPFDPTTLVRTFRVRANEAVVGAIGSALLERCASASPGVEVRFEMEGADDLDALRAGSVDLAIGSYGDVTRELRSEAGATEHLVGAVRRGHPLLDRRITLRSFARLDHVVVSRRGIARGPIDSALTERGLERRIVAVVPAFSAALAMIGGSDLVTVAPARLAAEFGRVITFPPPLALPTVTVHQIWHARDDVDAAHRWFRACVADSAAALPG